MKKMKFSTPAMTNTNVRLANQLCELGLHELFKNIDYAKNSGHTVVVAETAGSQVRQIMGIAYDHHLAEAMADNLLRHKTNLKSVFLIKIFEGSFSSITEVTLEEEEVVDA